jgi:hypothetical protein
LFPCPTKEKRQQVFQEEDIDEEFDFAGTKPTMRPRKNGTSTATNEETKSDAEWSKSTLTTLASKYPNSGKEVGTHTQRQRSIVHRTCVSINRGMSCLGGHCGAEPDPRSRSVGDRQRR